MRRYGWLLLIMGGLLWTGLGCSGSDETDPTTPVSERNKETEEAGSDESAETREETSSEEDSEISESALNDAANAPPTAKAEATEEVTAGDGPLVAMETSLGTIVIELYPDKAPNTVENFLNYVDKGYYEGTIFHRVISDFMIQGGGFTVDLEYKKEGLDAPIRNEADNGLKNKRGTIAMARTPDPHSATSQFFINVVHKPHLDHRAKDRDNWGYTVFGRVVDGMDVVDKIRDLPVRASKISGGRRETPVDPPVIENVTVVPADDSEDAGS